jgi:hypothetical protein
MVFWREKSGEERGVTLQAGRSFGDWGRWVDLH